jgi:hypothetical protein
MKRRLTRAKLRSARRREVIFIVVIVILAGPGVWLGVRLTNRPPPPPRSDSRFGPPETAYNEAARLSNSGRYRESLELFEYVAPAMGHRDWEFDQHYSLALFNAALQVEWVDGIPVPAVRTSLQRVRLLWRSLEQMDSAERLATNAAQRTYLRRIRANAFAAWGFPWETLSELHAARVGARDDAGVGSGSLDSARVDLDLTHSVFLHRMQHPVNADQP